MIVAYQQVVIYKASGLNTKIYTYLMTSVSNSYNLILFLNSKMNGIINFNKIEIIELKQKREKYVNQIL